MNKTITSIQVFGTGCSTCKKLHELTQQAVKKLNLNVDVEYINDIEKMLALGVMSSPVLVVNNKIMLTGQVPSLEKIGELLSIENIATPRKAGCCACSNKC